MRLAHAIVGDTFVARDQCPHRAQQIDHGAAARVQPDVAEPQLGIGMDRPTDQPEGSRGHVAGHTLVDCTHLPPSFHAPGHAARTRVLAPDVDATSTKHPLRMIPRSHRFPDGGPTLGMERREQDRGLDLCARNRCFVVHGP